jgi:hypothetical protein
MLDGLPLSCVRPLARHVVDGGRLNIRLQTAMSQIETILDEFG